MPPDPPLVIAGQYAAAGRVIGYSGTSGNSTGRRVHFETHVTPTAARPARSTPFRSCSYAVDDVCNENGCEVEIDRGLGYLCGDMPGGDEYGCGG